MANVPLAHFAVMRAERVQRGECTNQLAELAQLPASWLTWAQQAQLAPAGRPCLVLVALVCVCKCRSVGVSGVSEVSSVGVSVLS